MHTSVAVCSRITKEREQRDIGYMCIHVYVHIYTQRENARVDLRGKSGENKRAAAVAIGNLRQKYLYARGPFVAAFVIGFVKPKQDDDGS